MAAATQEKLPTGRHGLPRQFVVDSQRSRLFSAMAEAVAEKGYGATTVADVLKRAGVSRKTFYEQFSDKEDCFLAAYDTILNQLIEQVVAAYRSASEASEGIEAAVTEFVRFIEAEPAFARMCIVEAMAAGPKAIERRDVALRAFTSFFKRVRRRVADPSAIPDVAAEALVGAIHEVVYTRIVRNQIGDLERALPELTGLVMAVYSGPSSAAKPASRGNTKRAAPKARRAQPKS